MSSGLSKTSSSAERGPDYVALDLTYRCGLNCPFCFVRNNALLKPGRRELGTAALKRIIAGFAGRPRRFYLTGGEPTLRRDLPELVRAVKAGGHRCLITTNAQALTPAAARRLAAAGADELVISLHGAPAVHDAAAGVPGAFRRAALAVKAVTSLPAPRPEVTLWCTINRANHAGLPAVLRAMKALGPDHVAFNHLEYVSERDHKATAALFRKLGWPAPAFRPSERLARGIDARKLWAGVLAVKAAAPDARFYPDLDLAGVKAWYDPAARLRKPGLCSGQWNAAWLSPYGELLTCQPLARRISAGGDPLAAWAGPEYAAFRRALKAAGGFFPACARCGREPYQAKPRRRSC